MTGTSCAVMCNLIKTSTTTSIFTALSTVLISGWPGSKDEGGAIWVTFSRTLHHEGTVGLVEGHRSMDGARSLSRPRHSDYKPAIARNNICVRFTPWTIQYVIRYIHSICCAVARQCILLTASICTPLREQYILPDQYNSWLLLQYVLIKPISFWRVQQYVSC